MATLPTGETRALLRLRARFVNVMLTTLQCWCRHATAVFELKSVPPGGGGLAVIAGSHQKKFEEERVTTMAEGWRFNYVDTPWTSQQEGWPADVELHRLEGAAGDCIIFSEKCKHGTIPWSSQTSERRTLFYKYTPFRHASR